LFDQNLSRRLPVLLLHEYPGSVHVIALGLSNADGRTLWTSAASEGLAIVSKDRDFFDLATAEGPPPKLIWLRIGNGTTSQIEALLRARRVDVVAFLADPSAANLVLP
jgi:predicted nuclease of predicted toxin-antitoxin system